MVPSQIVAFIDADLRGIETPSGNIQLHPSVCGGLNALIRLIDELPDALLPKDPGQFAQLIRSCESIRFAVKRAELQDSQSAAMIGLPSLQPDGGGQPSPVRVIRNILAPCPDESPQRNSVELTFIKDVAVREGLLLDLEASRAALLNGEWKGATVLAGSLVEALLLWGITQKPPVEIQAACLAVVQSGKITKPPSDPLAWNLSQYLEVAAQLGIIDPTTAGQAKIAKDFRNLIHPGRAMSKGLVCDRGTALCAGAAVELVSRDLKTRFP